MSAPPGTLDERFSDEAASAVPWQRVDEVLASASLFSITTVRRDGRPHVCPLVAVRRG